MQTSHIAMHRDVAACQMSSSAAAGVWPGVESDKGLDCIKSDFITDEDMKLTEQSTSVSLETASTHAPTRVRCGTTTYTHPTLLHVRTML